MVCEELLTDRTCLDLLETPPVPKGRKVMYTFKWLVQLIEILDPWVRVILSRPELELVHTFVETACLETSDLVVIQCMLWGIPSAKTQIDSSNKCNHMIDNQYLFVMGPEEGILTNLIRRSLDKDIGMQIEERIFRICRIDRNSGSDIAEDNDEHFDTFFSFTLEKAIQPPFLGHGSRTTQILERG